MTNGAFIFLIVFGFSIGLFVLLILYLDDISSNKKLTKHRHRHMAHKH